MGTQIKICGVANAADAEAVAALKPDFMGFIFWPGSKRCVKPEDVGAWAKHLPPVPRVGVFVDATPDEVRRAVEGGGLSVVQLHGREVAESFRGLAQRLWQVMRIRPVDSAAPSSDEEGRTGFRVPEAPAFVDALMLDTYSPTSPGGTGVTGDWDLARRFVAASEKPVLLAGGLTPRNVAEAIRVVRPWGVDVSSGVEERPGKKDLSKVKDFIHAARND